MSSEFRVTKHMRAREKLRNDSANSRSLSPSTDDEFVSCTVGIDVDKIDRIGLAKMGMGRPKVGELTHPLKWSQNLKPELDFATPDYGPPRQDFWHNPSDPSTNLTGKFCVVRVSSPDSFWVQNLHQKREFRDLEKQMKEWYDNRWEANPGCIKDQDIFPGGFYAAYLKDYEAWVRVRILETAYGIRKDYHVYLLDYGYNRVVGLDCLNFLRHAYNQLPIQAVKMEMYYEGDSCDFTAEERNQFDKAIGGKEIDVIPLSSSEEDDVVFKTLRVVLMTRPVESEIETFKHSDFYNLNGRIKVDEMIRAIREFQATV